MPLLELTCVEPDVLLQTYSPNIHISGWCGRGMVGRESEFLAGGMTADIDPYRWSLLVRGSLIQMRVDQQFRRVLGDTGSTGRLLRRAFQRSASSEINSTQNGKSGVSRVVVVCGEGSLEMETKEAAFS
jgi:hypothetical protein